MVSAVEWIAALRYLKWAMELLHGTCSGSNCAPATLAGIWKIDNLFHILGMNGSSLHLGLNLLHWAWQVISSQGSSFLLSFWGLGCTLYTYVNICRISSLVIHLSRFLLYSYQLLYSSIFCWVPSSLIVWLLLILLLVHSCLLWVGFLEFFCFPLGVLLWK